MAHNARYHDDWKARHYTCTDCDWTGQGSALQVGEFFDALSEYDCPTCGNTLLLVSHPTLGEARANWEKLDEKERRQVEGIEEFNARFEREKLHDVDELPETSDRSFVLEWGFSHDEISDSRTLIKLGDRIICSEPAVYEGAWRFAQVATILKAKYGSRLKDLVPTERSCLYLYGDKVDPKEVADIRRRLFS